MEPEEASGSTPVTLRLNSTLDYEDPNQRKFILEVKVIIFSKIILSANFNIC